MKCLAIAAFVLIALAGCETQEERYKSALEKLNLENQTLVVLRKEKQAKIVEMEGEKEPSRLSVLVATGVIQREAEKSHEAVMHWLKHLVDEPNSTFDYSGLSPNDRKVVEDAMPMLIEPQRRLNEIGKRYADWFERQNQRIQLQEALIEQTNTDIDAFRSKMALN